MNSDNTLYIAETDEDGRIVCLWFSETTRKRPRPIRNPEKHLDKLSAAECSGASRDEIERWLKQSSATV